VELFKKAGDWELTVEHMIWLGQLELINGNPQSAQKWVSEAAKASQSTSRAITKRENNDLDGIMAFFQQQRNRTWAAFTLQIYGRIAFACGNYEEAYLSLSKSIELAQELGHRMIYFWSRAYLGYLLLRQGNLIEAYTIFADAVQNFQKDRHLMGVVFSLEGMASLYVVVDQHLHAARLIGWADATRKEADERRPPIEQADMDKLISICLAKIDEAGFSDAYDDGQKMTLDEAVAYALNES
jgi:tetratricopeptide (TPR) repeat protein